MKGTVLVTGAAGGIGTGLVEVLSAAGWAVLGSDHPEVSPAESTRERCLAWLPLDLAAISHDPELLEGWKGTVIRACSKRPLMGIVHNAALQQLGDFQQLSAAAWLETLSVNLLAPVAISRALLPQLEEHHGAIVHIGSIHSHLTKPGFTAYASSKAALNGLTRAMAVELGERVRVNIIEPAAIATPMLEAGFAATPARKTQLESHHPSGRIGVPADVARAVLFLLDPLNTFLNGCVLPLGGGIHSRLHDPV